MNNNRENLSKEMALFLKEKFLTIVECTNSGVSLKDTIVDIMSSKRLASLANRKVNGLSGDDYAGLKDLMQRIPEASAKGVSYFGGLLLSKNSWDFTTRPEDVDILMNECPNAELIASDIESGIKTLTKSSLDVLAEDLDIYFQTKDELGIGQGVRDSVRAVIADKAKQKHAQSTLSNCLDFLFGAHFARKIVKEDYWKKLSDLSLSCTTSKIGKTILEDIAGETLKASGQNIINRVSEEDYMSTINNLFPNGEVSYEVAGRFANKYFKDRMLGVSDRVMADRQYEANHLKYSLDDEYEDVAAIIDDCAGKSLEIMLKELSIDKLKKAGLKKVQDAVVAQDYNPTTLYKIDNNYNDIFTVDLKGVILRAITKALDIDFERKGFELTEQENSEIEKDNADVFRERIGFDGITAEECEVLMEELGLKPFSSLHGLKDSQEEVKVEKRPSDALFEFVNGKYVDQSNSARVLRKAYAPKDNVMVEYAKYRRNKLHVNDPSAILDRVNDR